ncbi:MAG: hypothetical protein RIS44_347 [Pseudomonadota bacterium]|jgi:predicted short-subunit dehydrogenase-like oxidoreductase (DUF2520 family)
MNDIAFIGAGRVATTLSQALANAGWSVKAVASKTMGSAEALASLLPNCQSVSVAEASQHPLVFLTVTDDAISSVCSELTWHTGQSVIHCSGATELLALESAATQGAQVGGFHPLQIFSDPQSALRNLPGSSVSIEAADPALATMLRDMAHALGMHPFDLPAGTRALYHASAGYAASLLLPLLHEAVQLWRELGVDETQALRALLPLAKGTLASVERRGLAGALSGPLSRGDLGVLKKHCNALDGLGGEHLTLYKTLTRLQWPLLKGSNRNWESSRQDVEALLGNLPG